MMQKLRLYLLLLCITGCATLHENHTQNIKGFAYSTKTLSEAPGNLYRKIADYRYDLRLVESSVVFTPEIVMSRLNKMVDARRKFLDNALQVNQAATLLHAYAECLLALTDNSYEKEWQKQSGVIGLKLSAALGTYQKSFSSKIPTSIGGFVGSVISQVGSMKLHQLQKRYLKSFVDTGALIINDVCDFFTQTASNSLETELSTLDGQFEQIMTTFYDKIKDYQENQLVNPYDYYSKYNPIYLDMKERLAGLHSLYAGTMNSMRLIKAAHEKLKLSVDLHQPAELIEEIKDLYAMTNDLQSSAQKLKK